MSETGALQPLSWSKLCIVQGVREITNCCLTDFRGSHIRKGPKKKKRQTKKPKDQNSPRHYFSGTEDIRDLMELPVLDESRDFHNLRSKTFSFKLFGSKSSNSKALLLENLILRKKGLINHWYGLLISTDVEAFVRYTAENKAQGAKNGS